MKHLVTIPSIIDIDNEFRVMSTRSVQQIGCHTSYYNEDTFFVTFYFNLTYNANYY